MTVPHPTQYYTASHPRPVRTHNASRAMPPPPYYGGHYPPLQSSGRAYDSTIAGYRPPPQHHYLYGANYPTPYLNSSMATATAANAAAIARARTGARKTATKPNDDLLLQQTMRIKQMERDVENVSTAFLSLSPLANHPNPSPRLTTHPQARIEQLEIATLQAETNRAAAVAAQATAARQQALAEQVMEQTTAMRIQQREVKKQLENDKRLFYSLASHQLEGVDVDRYDPVHDVHIPPARRVNGLSVYADPWRRTTRYPFDRDMMARTAAGYDPDMLLMNSRSNDATRATWSWKGRPIQMVRENNRYEAPAQGGAVGSYTVVSEVFDEANSRGGGAEEGVEGAAPANDGEEEEEKAEGAAPGPANDGEEKEEKAEGAAPGPAPANDGEEEKAEGAAPGPAPANEEEAGGAGPADAPEDGGEEAIVGKIFDIIDPNHTGSVSHGKFLRSVQLNTGNVQEILRQNDNLKTLLNAKSIESKYQEMDIDHDNHISVSEMVQFAKTL